MYVQVLYGTPYVCMYSLLSSVAARVGSGHMPVPLLAGLQGKGEARVLSGRAHAIGGPGDTWVPTEYLLRSLAPSQAASECQRCASPHARGHMCPRSCNARIPEADPGHRPELLAPYYPPSTIFTRGASSPVSASLSPPLLSFAVGRGYAFFQPTYCFSSSPCTPFNTLLFVHSL